MGLGGSVRAGPVVASTVILSHLSTVLAAGVVNLAVRGENVGRTDVLGDKILNKLGDRARKPRDENAAAGSVSRGDADNQTRGRNNAGVGAKHGGAEPADAVGTVGFGVTHVNLS